MPMCGRFVATASDAVLADYLNVDEVVVPAADTGSPEPSWNVAPTDAVRAASESRDGGRRLLGTYKWGLVPSWAKDVKIGARMINARAETLDSKFKAAFSRRRCLIPADGFYEWQKLDAKTKQPWFVHRADGAPMVFAGLWEVWRDPAGPEDGPLLRTCTIVTTSANDLVARIHDRMPAVLSPSDWDRWLDRSITDTAEVRDLLAPADPRLFEMYEVSTEVNSVRNNSGQLVLPLNSR
jgi:putative SOS response-associated peptidase YedK